MIDLTKYEGHTPGPWEVAEWRCRDEDGDVVSVGWQIVKDGVLLPMSSDESTDGDHPESNAILIADAPKLLAEVKRLRQDLHDTIRESRKYRAERDDLYSAILGIKKDLETFEPSCDSMMIVRTILAKHRGAK